MSPCVSPCPLQYLHAVYLCVVFVSLCTSMLSVYESYGVLWCICLHVDSLYVSVPVSVLPMCLHVVSVQSACVCVCVCVVCVYVSLYISAVLSLCAVSLLFSVSQCELMLPWYACLHVTCVFLCLCVHHICLCGLSSAVYCLAYFLWPLRQFL